MKKFGRKLLEMDRPLTIKEKLKAKTSGDKLYLKLTKPPKGYVMNEKTFKRRQQAKSGVSAYKKYLDSK